MTTIQTNSFARRQTPDSRFSHYEGTWEELEALVTASFDKALPGNRDGVLLVPVPADRFRSAVVEVEAGMPLEARFESRRSDEDPYISVTAPSGVKCPARAVDVIIYRHDVLAADGDAETGADWEIISINARATDESEPPSPVAMARNFLALPGGTLTPYTAEEFARSIMYWSRRCMAG